MLKDMGWDAYRFSISWSRLLPSKTIKSIDYNVSLSSFLYSSIELPSLDHDQMESSVGV